MTAYVSHSKALAHINLAKSMANELSKGRRTRVGCLITSKDLSPLSWGYNGFPRKVKETEDRKTDRNVKLKYTEHAERNALYNAARHGISLLGSVAFLNELMCCVDCTRGLLQSGIVQIYVEEKALLDEGETQQRWREDRDIIMSMIKEAGAELFSVSETELTYIHE